MQSCVLRALPKLNGSAWEPGQAIEAGLAGTFMVGYWESVGFRFSFTTHYTLFS